MEPRIIIETALENLQEQTGLVATWHVYEGPNAAEIEFIYNNELYHVPVEIKKQVQGYEMGRLLRQKQQFPTFMVVANYIYPKVKQQLRAEGIGYLETNGNIFLKTGPLFLWVENQKTKPIEKDATGRAFAKTGLKLIFHFLIEDDLLNLTYREMAKRTGVNFSNINFIMTDLREQGFLLNINKNTYKLTRKEELLQKWVRAFQEKLKPTLEIGTFRFANEKRYFDWKDINMPPGETYWGGEPAGGILTNYLQPQQYTLYTTEPKGVLMRDYQLLPDKQGDVKAYLKFWKLGTEQGNTVPVLLVYADLINSNDRRCLETAERLYHDYLQTELRTN